MIYCWMQRPIIIPAEPAASRPYRYLAVSTMGRMPILLLVADHNYFGQALPQYAGNGRVAL